MARSTRDDASFSENKDQKYRYWCFISYSHHEKHIAVPLQRFLENYTPPGPLRTTITPPAGLGVALRPVFRDETELGAASSLTDALHDALTDSYALVVLCSPNAARSRWVDEEIRLFRALGREQRVFLMLIEGEPNVDLNGPYAHLECLPPALRRSDRGEEPLAADLRGGKPAFKSGALRLAAGLWGVTLDELVHRHRRRQRQQLAAAATLGLTVTLLGGVAAVRVAADRTIAQTIGDARAEAAARRPRSAEALLKKAPTWAVEASGASIRRAAQELKRSLGFSAGDLPEPRFGYSGRDTAYFGQPQVSGDGRRIAITESRASIADNPENTWISVYDVDSGQEVAHLTGREAGLQAHLNRDGTVVVYTSGDELVFVGVDLNKEISRFQSLEEGNLIFFALPSLDRVVAFAEGGASLYVLDMTTGNAVDTLASPDGSAIRVLGIQDDNGALAHGTALFNSGALQLVDLKAGGARQIEVPADESATGIVWTSSTRDAALVLFESGNLGYLRGSTASLDIVAPPVAVASVVSLSPSRFAVVNASSRDSLVFFSAGDGGDGTARELPEQILGIGPSGGQRSVFAITQSRRLYLVFDDEEREPVELAGGRSSPTTFVSDESHGLFAVGTTTGHYLIGRADAGVLLREGMIGNAPIVRVSLDDNGAVARVWDGEGRRIAHELRPPRIVASFPVPRFNTLHYLGEDTECPDLAWADATRRVAVRTNDGLTILDLSTLSKPRRIYDVALVNSFGGATTFAFDPSGRWLAAEADNVIIFDAETGVRAVADDPPRIPFGPTTRPTEAPYLNLTCVLPRDMTQRAPSVVWTGAYTFASADGTGYRIEVDADGQTPRIVEANTSDPPSETVDDDPNVEAVVQSPRGDRQLQIGWPGNPTVLTTSDGTHIATVKLFEFLDSAQFNRSGSRLLVASSTSGFDATGRPHGGYGLLDAFDGRVILEHRAALADASNVVFSPNGDKVLINMRTGVNSSFMGLPTYTTLLDAKTGAVFAELTQHLGASADEFRSGGYADAVFSKDGSMLVAVRHSGVIDIWNLD